MKVMDNRSASCLLASKQESFLIGVMGHLWWVLCISGCFLERLILCLDFQGGNFSLPVKNRKEEKYFMCEKWRKRSPYYLKIAKPSDGWPQNHIHRKKGTQRIQLFEKIRWDSASDGGDLEKWSLGTWHSNPQHSPGTVQRINQY